MRYLLKYPTRSRPTLFELCVSKWTQTASGEHDFEWLVSADLDDPTMNNAEIRAWCDRHDIAIHYGHSRSKVEAVNADMDKSGEWDVLVLVSDDMIPNPGWDATIAEHMSDDLRMGLWFHDGRQKRLCTLSVFGRPILDEVLGGFIYHPAFSSVYCDNYYQWLMQRAGKLRYIDKCIARHAWREQNNDDLMKRNESRPIYEADRRTYHRLIGEAALA